MDSHLVFGPDVVVDNGKAWKIIGAAGFFHDRVGVVEDLFNGHGVHLATVVVARLDGVLEVTATIVPFHSQWRDSPVQRSVTLKSSYMVVSSLVQPRRMGKAERVWPGFRGQEG
jgi:hypothetical protein